MSQTQSEFVWVAEQPADTDHLGRRLVDVLPETTTVALIGTLGAGKTRLVQAMASAVGLDPQEVTSPTFVLCQHLCGSRTLYHMDAYRLADEDEFLELGPEEYFQSSAITLVEWADRVLDCLPPDRVEIRIEVTGETRRSFRITPVGARYGSVIDALRRGLQSP